MFEGLSGVLSGNAFYKSPVPLLLGNSPFSDTKIKDVHQYKYQDYYKLVTGNGNLIYYDEFCKNWNLFYVDSSVEISDDYKYGVGRDWESYSPSQSPDCWMYLNVSFKPNTSKFKPANFRTLKHNMFHLNPFVNDYNGICSFISNLPYSSATMYYNVNTDRFEVGFGQDSFTVSGAYLTNTDNDNLNGMKYLCGGEDKANRFVQASRSNQDLYTDVEVQKNLFNTDYRSCIQAINGYFTECNSTNIAEGNRANFNNLIDKSNITKYVDVKTDLSGSYTADVQLTYKDNSYIYFKTDKVPDLDYLKDDKLDNILGVYENLSGKQVAVGSWVIGTDNDTFGNFVGVNDWYPPYDTYYPESKIDNCCNCFSISDNEVDDVCTLFLWDDYYQQCEVLLGTTYNLDSPKYLMQLRSDLFEEPFLAGRLFIIDSQIPHILKQRKLWYCDKPKELGVEITDIIGTPSDEGQKCQLFKSKFVIQNQEFEELVFHYINLDDEEDIKSPITLKVKGLTRENPIKLLFGNQVINSRFNSLNQYWTYDKTSTIHINSNVYLGHWAAPGIKFLGEE